MAEPVNVVICWPVSCAAESPGEPGPRRGRSALVHEAETTAGSMDEQVVDPSVLRKRKGRPSGLEPK
jgi:hypothetical protein